MKVPRRTVLKGALLLTGCAAVDAKENDDERDNDMNHIPMSDSQPVTLRSFTSISGSSDEEIAAAPLTNASGEPMEIHEFIFSVRPSNNAIARYGTSGLFPSGGQFALGISVKDSTDFGYSLTNGVIPLWSYGQARQLGQEEKLQTLQVDEADLQAGAFLTAVYAWKLDHPLYVPPGGRIIPVARSLGSFTGDAEIGITAIGRILPNTPASRASYKVPWVCAYVTKSFDFAEGGEDTSKDNDLYNPFADKPVTIERFVGRLHCFTTVAALAGSGLTTVDQVTVHDVSAFDYAFIAGLRYTGNNYYSQLFSLRMRDSVGNPLVREKTLFRNVFESATRTWECRHILPPRQFHKLDFFKEATEATNARLSRLQASVASIGWREVSWKRA